jgi:DNA-binding CsgD family transcriptional regulator/PAS domain-containing protein
LGEGRGRSVVGRKGRSAEAELHRAVDLLYRTCTEPAAWPDALAAAARPLGASGGCAFWADETDPGAAVVWLRHHGLDPGAMDLYLREFTRVDPWLAALREPRRGEGRAVTGAALVDPASLRRTRFGAELLPRLGVGRLLTGFAAAEERRWGLLQRHTRRAIWLRERLALAGAQEAALDRLAHGLLLLDGGARVLFANRAARAALDERDGLSHRDARLVVGGKAAAAAERLIGEAASPDPARPASAGGVLAVPRPSGKRPWQLIASPLPPDLASELPAGGRTRVLVVVSDPERRPTPPAEHLRLHFGLTPQEARLVLLLCEGLELKQAAERLGVGYATARSHLKAALAKAGLRRQTQLVARVLATAALRPG